ncbi:MAG TPA: FAD-dependent oxidoreductase [Candidatus Limnocylindrales bacterium]|nr:FAD-dependent oxidoreductase [Candidatus Limnocylindrales bacterium]
MHDVPRTADVVVIGGGIAGCATAFFAQRAGLRTALVEKRPALATLTTPVSTGAFRLQFDNPEEMALVRDSVALFADLEARGHDLEIRRQGYLFAALTDAGAVAQAELVTRQRDWGLHDVELLTSAQARSRFPYLGEEVKNARFRQQDGWLNPRRLSEVLAQESGATIVLGHTVTGFLRDGGRVAGVRLGSDAIAAPWTILCAGPFSSGLAAQAGLPLPIRPVRRHKLVLPDVPQVPQDAPMTIEYETGAHWRPALRGAFALWTAPAGEETPLEDPPTSAAFAFGLLDPRSDHALARVAPFWNEVWGTPGLLWWLQAGYYDYTPDHRPLLGPSAVPGLALNTGYSGHGIMAGPGGSRLAIDVLTGAIKAEDNPFRPDRPMIERAFDVL